MKSLLEIFCFFFCFIKFCDTGAVPSKFLDEEFDFEPDTSKPYVWEGACGNPTLLWSEVVGLSQLDKKAKMKEILDDHAIPPPEDVALSMPWIIDIWLPNRDPGTLDRNARIQDRNAGHFYRAAALIRVKAGYDSSDLAVTSADACEYIRSSIKDGLSPMAVFGVHQEYVAVAHVVAVENCYKHQKHISGTLNSMDFNNIGILKLAEFVPFTSRIRPVCIPDADEKVGIGTTGFVAEWKNHLIRKAPMRVAKRSNCSRLLSRRHGNDVFCIVSDKDDRFGYDQYATGGPFIVLRGNRYVMMGVAVPGKPSLLSSAYVVPNVAHYVENGWLQGAIKATSELWARGLEDYD